MKQFFITSLSIHSSKQEKKAKQKKRGGEGVGGYVHHKQTS